MQEILMTPDVCMRFLVWSYYYHELMPLRAVSYKAYGKFTDDDSERLDELKDTLFKCFEEQSVVSACKQFQWRRKDMSLVPFSKEKFDNMFAKEIDTQRCIEQI